MNVHFIKRVVILCVALFLCGCAMNRMFVVRDKIIVANATGGWKIEAFTDRVIDDAPVGYIFCDIHIEHSLFFEKGLNVCAQFVSHGPFDMKDFGSIMRNSVRTHYAFVGECKDRKVCIEIAQENFDSLEALDAYLEKCINIIGCANISFSTEGILCRIFTNRDLGYFDVDLSKIAINGHPLSNAEYRGLRAAKQIPWG